LATLREIAVAEMERKNERSRRGRNILPILEKTEGQHSDIKRKYET
jgi:hypothetical protein